MRGERMGRTNREKEVAPSDYYDTFLVHLLIKLSLYLLLLLELKLKFLLLMFNSRILTSISTDKYNKIQSTGANQFISTKLFYI